MCLTMTAIELFSGPRTLFKSSSGTCASAFSPMLRYRAYSLAKSLINGIAKFSVQGSELKLLIALERTQFKIASPTGNNTPNEESSERGVQVLASRSFLPRAFTVQGILICVICVICGLESIQRGKVLNDDRSADYTDENPKNRTLNAERRSRILNAKPLTGALVNC